MTMEAYPKKKEFDIIYNMVDCYLSFIVALKKARESNIDNDMLLSILDLFYTVKIDDETIGTLKNWIKELQNLSE